MPAKIKILKKKHFYRFFSTFGDFSVTIKKKKHQKRFARILLEFTVINYSKNVFLLCYDKKLSTLFVKFLFYHNGQEMTEKFALDSNRTFFKFLRFYPTFTTQTLCGKRVFEFISNLSYF